MKSIFVSSTFKDMQFERDFMQSDIIPALNKFAMGFGQQLRFVDLRWGVNTADLESAEGANKVLSVCLDEIDNCNPYMIVILGERYGWVPDSKHLLQCAKNKNYEIDNPIKSVTALEIEYGALSEKSKPENCLFFIREGGFMQDMPPQERAFYESENKDSLHKLNVLKSHLIENFKNQVFHYSPAWDKENNRLVLPDCFKEKMIHGVKNLMQKDFERIAGLHVVERDERIANLYFEEKQAQFSTRFDRAQAIADKIKNDKELLFILKGQAGSGRSSLAAQITKQLVQENISCNIFVAHAGSQTEDIFSLLKHFIYNLQKLLFLETQAPENYEHAKQLFEYLLCSYGEQSMPLHVFTIVHADSFNAIDELTSFKMFPQHLPSSVKFMFVFHGDTYYRLPLHLREFAYETTMEMLNDVQKNEMIKGILAAHRKELDEKVISTIVRKKGTELPLYINLIAQRLLIFDVDDFEMIKKLGNDMDAISEYMCFLVEDSSDDISQLALTLLIEIAEKINYKNSMQTLMVISLSVNGLRQADIESVLSQSGWGYSAVDASRLFLYLGKMLKTGPNGELSFAYDIFGKKLVDFTDKEELTTSIYQMIFEHLKQLDLCDPVRMSSVLYYAALLQDYGFMVDYLKVVYENEKSEIFDNVLKQFEHLHLYVEDYKELSQELLQAAEKQGHVFYLFVLYRKIIEALSGVTTVINNEFTIYITQFLLNHLHDLGYLDVSGEKSAFLSLKEEIVDLYGRLLEAAAWSVDISAEKMQELCDTELIELCASGIHSDNYDEQILAYLFIERTIRFAVAHDHMDLLKKYPNLFIDFSKTEFDRAKEPTFALYALSIMCELARRYSTGGILFENDEAVQQLQSALEFGESLKVNGEVPLEFEGYFVQLYQAAVFIYEMQIGKLEEIEEYADKSIELLLKINSEINNAASIEALADMYFSKGKVFFETNQWERAIETFLKAEEYFAEVLTLNLTHQAHYHFAQNCSWLIHCYEKLKNYKRISHYGELEFAHRVKFYELTNNRCLYLKDVIETIEKIYNIFYNDKKYEQSIVWIERYAEYLQKYADTSDCICQKDSIDWQYIHPVLFEQLDLIRKNTNYKGARHTKNALKDSLKSFKKNTRL